MSNYFSRRLGLTRRVMMVDIETMADKQLATRAELVEARNNSQRTLADMRRKVREATTNNIGRLVGSAGTGAIRATGIGEYLEERGLTTELVVGAASFGMGVLGKNPLLTEVGSTALYCGLNRITYEMISAKK